MSIRKILHAADIHLDSPLQKLALYENAPADRIRSASRRALAGMVDLAIDQKVDLVVIAGDLYDGDWPDQSTGLCFVGQAARLLEAGIPLFVIRGNHDAQNLMTSSLPLPPNPDGSPIMMRSDGVDLRRLDDVGIAVHGRSFRTRAELNNLAEDYPKPIPGMFNVGLLHTSLSGAEGHDTYSPCSPKFLSEKQYDYWALGHIHTRQDHAIDDGPPIVFPGNLQGRHVRETGPKGCVILDVDQAGKIQSQFHPLDVVRWERLTIDTSQMEHTDEVGDRFRDQLGVLIAACPGRLLVVRVDLVGTTMLHDQLHRQIDSLRSDLQAVSIAYGGSDVWLENIKVHTQPPLRSTDEVRSVEMEGPMESIASVLDFLRHDAGTVDVVRNELAALLKNMPSDLTFAEGFFPTDDDQWVSELIESAASKVSGQISIQGSSNA